jgi:amino acid adenylation domain-containing protein
VDTVNARPSAALRTPAHPASAPPPELVSAPILPQPAWTTRQGGLPEATVPELFEAVVARRPEAVAVRLNGAGLTYAELNARANRLAHFLRARGVGPDQPVAICTERSVELVVGQLGILKAGGAYVPLDAASPPERLAVMLEDTAATIILTQRHLLDHLPAEARSRAVCLDVDWPEIARHPEADLASVVGPDHLAYIIYTSGSTGRPKGVAVPHRGIVRLVHGQDYAPFGPEQRILLLASPAFDAIVFELWGALLHGGCSVIFPERWPEFARLEEIIRGERVTCLWLTAGLFNQIIDHRPETLAFARHVLAGGEALSVRHVRRAQKLLPHVAFTNGYGPTECTTFACTYRIGPAGEWENSSIPIGRPLNHTECHIVDEKLAPVPVGEPGELLLGGAGLARGYHRREELTAEKFIPNPFNGDPSSRLYRTGDRCRWRPDGLIEYLGRVDDQIKLRGFRIEPGEIEAALRALPGVQNCTVFAREAGAGRQLVAVVAALPGGGVVAAELRARLVERLPDYMVPARIRVIDTLPLNANGKVDRRALAALFADEHPGVGSATPFPDLSGSAATAAPGAPGDGVPAPAGGDAVLAGRLLTLWRRVLGQPGLRVTDSFFEHGGDSLLSIQLALEIERALGRRVSMRMIYEHPSAAAFARQWPEHETQADRLRLRGHGPGAPLFHIPGVGGVEKLSVSRAALLKGRRPYYDELAHPGVGDDAEPLQTVAELADEMARQIRRIHPEGPVVLSGFSFGGVLAYETARRLRAAGHGVEQVVLWDSMCDDLIVRKTPWEVVRDLVRKSGRHFWRTAARGRFRDFFFPRPSPAQRVLWLKLLDRVLPKGFVDGRLRGLLPHRDTICLANLRAYHAYRPEPYDGDVLLFRCTSYDVGLLHRLKKTPAHNWERHVRGRLTVQELHCAHEDMMDEPVATVIMEKTLRALDLAKTAAA